MGKKARSPLTKLISSYAKVTCPVVEAKAADVVYLAFTKAFDTISHSIPVEKLTAHVLDGCKNWLAGWLREWWGMELNPAGGWSLVAGHLFPRAQLKQILFKYLYQ